VSQLCEGTMDALLDKHFINGQLVPPVKGQYLECINPHDETVFGRFAAGTAEDIDMAVASAFEAQKTWGKTTGKHRAAILNKIADCVEAHKDALAKKEAVNSGKPLLETIWDIEDVSGCFRYMAFNAEALDARQGKKVDVEMAEFDVKLFYEPVGVVGAITPWNYPALMATWKVAAALAAGCTVVLKPSELAPFTCVDLAVIAHKEAGLPAGVLNVVTGDGPMAGAPLTAHKHVDKVTFTGSVATGKKVMQACAEGVRNISLELGGKSPILVFEDADIDSAVEWLLFGVFWTNGQICSSTSRALVHESIAEKLMVKVKEVAEKIVLCDPLTPAKDGVAYMGPLINKTQRDKVLALLASAKQEGANVLTGGGPPAGCTKGFYVAPTVLTNVEPHMRVWKEEVFGPVLCVKTFSTEEQALSLANDTWSGLASAVLTADPKRSERVAKELRTGIVWVNCSQPCFCHAPWGGMKLSGIGRDNGEAGFNSFLEPKQVCAYVGKEPWGWFSPPGFTRPKL